MPMIDIENPMLYLPTYQEFVVHGRYCVCCGRRVLGEDIVLLLEGEMLCDEDCLKEYLGVRTVKGWEIQQ